MKRILNLSLAALLLLFVSCEEELADLNKNKTNPTEIDPAFILNNAIINTSIPSVTLVYELGIVQQIISPNGGVLAGANFNQDNRSVGAQIWPAYYQNVIKNTRDVINRTKDVPERSNLYNMARILQSYAFMVLTDTYGDVPYSEAGVGYTDQKFFPVYDKQQDIYNSIIQTITEACAALGTTGKTETSEILYGGNTAQWKKFGYSILLRAGMRLMKADAAKAEATVKAAAAGGVILANADNAMMRHDANYQNPLGGWLNSTEAANFYLTKPFIDQLKSTNDPRLSAIAVRYMGATSGSGQTAAAGSTLAANQIGMPMGKDNGTVVAAAASDGLKSFYEYSQADRRRIAKTTSPAFFVTAAQTNLLLAEARQKGWISTGTVESYYNAGVTLHMEQMASYDAACAIPAASITAFLTANPFNASKAIEQINTQYWIASFLNGPEGFANFRRSGYPALAPNPYPGKDISGNFINRITYPNSEISVNNENVSDAISRQGPDNMDTKVWWHK